MATVWRVQNKEGYGCYTFGACYKSDELKRLYVVHSHLKRTPRPDKDLGIMRLSAGAERCGFRSIYQMLKWFTKKELFMLTKHGFYVTKIDNAIITAQGRSQVLFIGGVVDNGRHKS